MNTNTNSRARTLSAASHWMAFLFSAGIALATLLLAAAALSAQQAPPAPRVTVGGQVRPRMERRTPVNGDWDTFTSMRVRATLKAELEKGVTVFAQLQDVRLFGEEANTLGDYRADAFDLHQGWVEMANLPGIGGNLRVGRQELILGDQRLVGAVDWAQQGRSFDGARWSATRGRLAFSLFGMRLQEGTSAAHDFSADFLGAYGTVRLGGAGALDLFALRNSDSRSAGDSQTTWGGLWKGKIGPVALRAEGALQGGERGGAEVAASMLGLRGETEIRPGTTLALWYDRLSGDENPGDGTVKVFSTLFATNHIYYGLADLFTDIPAHTKNLGLQDLAARLALRPFGAASLSVDLHSFRTARAGTLSTKSLANEVDLTVTYPLSAGLTAIGGYSFVQARDGIQEMGRLGENAHWAFLMLNAVF